MFDDENYPPLDFASLPRVRIKRHFKRTSPVAFHDLEKLVRVVKPLSERYLQHLGPVNDDDERLQSHPSLFVTLAVANDEVCRVQVEEDLSRAIDVWHSEISDVRQTLSVDRQVVERPFGKLRNVIVGQKSQWNGSVPNNVVGLEELTTVELSSDMSLCSDDDIVDSCIMVDGWKVSSWKASGGSVRDSEDMAKLERQRRVLVEQLSFEAEGDDTLKERQYTKDLSTGQKNVRWQLPAISETMVQNCDSINYYSNSESNGRNSNRNDFANDGSWSQRHTTSEYRFSELDERDGRNDSLNRLVELKGQLKTKHGKEEHIGQRKHLKEQIEIADEDILNEGWMELEKALKRRTESQADDNNQKKLENADLFHGRPILVGRCAPPLSIPLEDVSNEKHYRWKDGQLESYMTDPRIVKHFGQRKDNPASYDLIQLSFAKSTYEATNMSESAGIFRASLKSEPCFDPYEVVETTSKTPSGISLQNYSEKARCCGTSSVANKSKNATISNVPQNGGSDPEQVAASEYLPMCTNGTTFENVGSAYPIPIMMSQSYFSYVDNVPHDGPADLELDQNVLPPDWMDEHCPETQDKRSACCYVNETLRNVARCIWHARVISDDAYRDAMLTESLQCIMLALNIHSKL